MASQPVQPPISARVDAAGRLLFADPPLMALQEQAGGRLGGMLCVPQLAAVARLAARLGIPINREATAANDSEDLMLQVRAEPDPEGVSLYVSGWNPRLPGHPRWSGKESDQSDAGGGTGEDLMTDPELRVRSLSPGLARRLGIAGDDVVGQALAKLLRPVEDADGNLPLLAALAARAAFDGQPALVRGTGEALLLEGRPHHEEERFAGWSIRVRLPGSEPATLPKLPLDDLLKEPLASIIGQAQEIAARSEGPLRNDYAGYGSDIAAAARHLLALLASINPDPVPDVQPGSGEVIDLAELVLDAAALLQPQAAARGIVLDIGGTARLTARGQGRSVTQILVNLIGNAVRFSPTGASVAITLADGAAAAVTVSDEGPGVAPSDRKRIFERFEQAGPKPGEAGLGLAISRRLARDMGGDVELLDSPAGAAFRLVLPAA